MTQYFVSIQIEEDIRLKNIGWLAQIFEVTAKDPIPAEIFSLQQVILTNKESYDSIVAVYEEHTTAAIFSYDEQMQTVSCSDAYEHTWNIN